MDEQFQQLAAQQVNPQAQAPQMPTVNGQDAQPVQQMQQPVNAEPQAPQMIPYSRFQEVVQQKNQALAEREAAIENEQQATSPFKSLGEKLGAMKSSMATDQ